MTRYAPGTVVDYVPLDRERLLAGWLDRLEPPPSAAVRQAARDLVLRCRTEASVQCYGQEISAYLRWCGQVGLDPLAARERDAAAYAASLARYAQGTQNLKLLVARAFFAMAQEREFVAANPFAQVRLPSRLPEVITPALTKAQVELLLRATQAVFDDPQRGLTARRDYALLTVMVRLGLRTAEVSALRWGRFQDHDGRIRGAFLGKGQKPANLDVPPDVWVTLQHWRDAYERTVGAELNRNDPVFLPCDVRVARMARARTGQSPLPPLQRRSIHNLVVARLADVGLSGERLGPHALRATCAVLAYHAGASIIEIQAMLRHSNVETTMRYLQALVGGAARSAIDRITLDVLPWEDEEAVAPARPPSLDASAPDAEPASVPAGAPTPRLMPRPHPTAVANARRRRPAGADVRDPMRWAALPLSAAARAYLAALRADGRATFVAHVHRTCGLDAGECARAEQELLEAGLIVLVAGRRVARTARGMAVDLPPAARGAALSAPAAAVFAALPEGGATRWGHLVRADLWLDPDVFEAAVRELRGAGRVRIGRGGTLARIVLDAPAAAPDPVPEDSSLGDGDPQAA